MTTGSGAKKPSLKKALEEVGKVKKEDDLDKKADERLADEAVLDRSSTRALREDYASKVYWYLVCYSVAAYALIVAEGFKFFNFSLPNYLL